MNDAYHNDLPGKTARGPVDNGLPPGVVARQSQDHATKHLIDVRAIWSTVYRNRFLMIGALVVCIALGVIVTFLSTPIYKATAQIQIDIQEAKIIEGADVKAPSQDADRFLQTQVDVLQSRSLARAVATQLGLFRDPTFLPLMHMKVAEAPQGSFNLAQTQREQVVNALEANLKVKLPVDSSAVNVSFQSPDRALSAKIANSFADNFITSNLRRKFDTSAYARQFLENQLKQTRQRLEESERALIDYARSARLIDTGSGQSGAQSSGPSSLTTSSLIQLNQNLSQAIADRIKTEERWRETTASPLMNLSIVQQNPAISALVQQRAQLRAQYQQNSKRYDPSYATQQELQAQMDTLSAQATRIATELRDGIRQDYAVAQRQENALKEQLTQFKSTTLAEQDRGVRYNILRREVDTNRTLYDGLLQRYKEISAASGISANNISIIDRADPPIGAVSPRPLLNLALAIVAGLLAGSGLIFLRENFNDLIRSTNDVERMLGLAAIGVIPKLKEDTNAREEMADRKSDMSEAYAALRTKLLLSTPTGAPKSLIFTSSGPGEGKSTSALATARSFAQIGRKVILIDADMRRPSQHKRFEVDNARGLSSLLASQETFENVLIDSDQPGLDLITAGPVPVNPAELIAAPGMQALIERCERAYDIVIIDAPPVLGLADAPTLVANVGSTIFVVEANRVHGRQAKDALGRLVSGNTHVLGVLLTKFDAKSIGYSSNDYGYVYNYGERPA
ncbi:GumC family protein [Sphingomonas faeni]|uniref:GumC family protein n=1 Tax=Sphingomonas faeni TaxID=185950 RepID=UPI0020C7D146|nr:polysaccharide biosynthesis tyrosine autokinase [Sphingomonas faeni]MCP8890709.1 polysaccharide biosynthesis tyrosine autokinase [Sphingomonas faeni]